MQRMDETGRHRMGLDATTISEVKGFFTAAKQREINFGLCLGSKPEGLALKLHRTQSPEALGKAAKAAADTPKMACGTLKVDENTALFRCQNDPPPGILKQTKKYLKTIKLGYRVRFLTPDGQDIADEDEQAQEGVEDVGGDDTSGVDPLAEEWRVLHERLDPTVLNLLSKGAGDVGKLRAAWATAAEAAQEGDYASALRIGRNVESLLPSFATIEGGQTGTPVDPSAAKWVVGSRQVGPLVEAALKRGTGQPDKIRAVWAFAQGKAHAQDFASAVKALGPLAQLLAEARASDTTPTQEETANVDVGRTKVELLAAKWKSASETLEGLMTEVLKKNPTTRRQIEAVWGFAHEKAEHATEADYTAALKALAKLKELLDTAVAETMPTGGVESGKEALATDQKVKTAQTHLDANATTAKAVLARLRKEFEPTLPPSIDGLATEVDRLLSLAAPGTDTAIEERAQALEEQVLKLEEAAAKPRKERADWLQAQSIFEVRLLTLENHPLHDEATTIKPLIEAIKLAYEAAKRDATAMKWVDAANALTPLLVKCEEAEKQADNLAHYNAVRQARVDQLATLPDPTTITQEPAKKAVEAAKKLLADADLAKDGKDFKTAVDLLNQIPAAVDGAARLATAAGRYDTEYGNYENYVRTLEAYTGVAAGALGKGLESFKKSVESADYNTTNDYMASMRILDGLGRQYNSLATRALQARAYSDALDEFKVRLATIKKLKGLAAIEEFYRRMEADAVFADTRAKKSEYKAAEDTLTASKALHDDQVAIAAKKERYDTELKNAKDALANIDLPENQAKIGAEIAEARRRISLAETAASKKDWDGALKALEAADERIQAAVAQLSQASDLANLKDRGKLDAIATNFGDAYGVYEAMRKHVEQKDPGGVFTKRLQGADAPAQAARDESVKERPNFPAALENIEKAIGVCEAVLLLIGKKASFDAAIGPVRTAHTTTLPGLNVDDCIKAKIDAIGTLITEADNLVKAETFDFDSGQVRIGSALAKIKESEQDAAAYALLKPDWNTLEDALTYIKHPSCNTAMAPDILRLETAKQEILNSFNGDDMAGAKKKAAATAKLCPPIKALADTYIAARKAADDLFLKYPLYNDAAYLPEYTIMLKNQVQIEKCFTDRAYSAVQAIVDEVGTYPIPDADAIYWAMQSYEPTQLQAKTKLDDGEKVNPKLRTAATEERYKALRDTYDKAVGLAGARNYGRATKMLKPISGDVDALIPDATAYHAYATALEAADAKLLEVTNSRNADAVKPLLTHLTGRRADAVKLATAGDYKGAKKILDTLVTDATSALLTATEAGIFADAAKDMKKTPEEGGKPLAEAIADAERMYQDLMGKPSALYAFATLRDVKAMLEDAKKQETSDPAKAREALVKTVDACAKARVEMGNFDQMTAEMKTLTDEINSFLGSHAQAGFVRKALEQITQDVEAAGQLARSTGQHEEPSKKIAAAESAFTAQQGVADAHVAFVAESNRIEALLVKMEKHANRYSISAEIVSVRKDITDAAGKEGEGDHKAAMDLLAKADGEAAGALLKAKMHANEEPSPDDVKKILAQDKGSEKLDKILATLGPQAKRKVLLVAFEARFDCKMNVYASEGDFETGSVDSGVEEKDPNIRRFYDLMCKLPDKYTKDNDSMQDMSDIRSTSKPSDYAYQGRRVSMREGEAGASSPIGVSLPHELDEIDPGCETDPGETPTYFDWNTLHEVGHAIDDKLGFMKSNATTHGQWTEYWANIEPVAAIVAAEFGFDKKYIMEYMSGTADPTMPEPVGCAEDEWERRRIRSVHWVDLVRSTAEPWQVAASAKETAINNVCYQESYPNYWTSYPLAERKKGVTAYQFRAPAEWFSELYAAFHTKKMKSSHPAYSWLSTL